jgi:hypothetical protein
MKSAHGAVASVACVASVAFAGVTLLGGCSRLVAAQNDPQGLCTSDADCPSGTSCQPRASGNEFACQPSLDASGPLDADASMVDDVQSPEATTEAGDTSVDVSPTDATMEGAVDTEVGEASPGDAAEGGPPPGDAENDPARDASEDQVNPDVEAAARSVCAPSSAADAAAPTRLLLFGGDNENDSSFLNDTWEWDGSAWSQDQPAQSPPARYGAGMATLCGHPTLFGGGPNFVDPYFSDQWEWDGVNWTRQQPAPSPAERFAPTMTALGSTILLFGGLDDHPDNLTGLLNDTWTWSGASWTPLDLASPPDVRGDAASATLGETVVVFGGTDPSGSFRPDTLVWDGAAWSLAQPLASPSARAGASAAALGNQVVLFGGFDDTYTAVNDTWTWDGTNWTEVFPQQSPPPRFHAMVATLNGQVVLFGGEDPNQTFADTWIWDGTNWTPGPTDGPPARAEGAMSAF